MKKITLHLKLPKYDFTDILQGKKKELHREIDRQNFELLVNFDFSDATDSGTEIDTDLFYSLVDNDISEILTGSYDPEFNHFDTVKLFAIGGGNFEIELESIGIAEVKKGGKSEKVFVLHLGKIINKKLLNSYNNARSY